MSRGLTTKFILVLAWVRFDLPGAKCWADIARRITSPVPVTRTMRFMTVFDVLSFIPVYFTLVCQ